MITLRIAYFLQAQDGERIVTSSGESPCYCVYQPGFITTQSLNIRCCYFTQSTLVANFILENELFMSTDNQSFDIKELEDKLDELIQQYNSVRQENTTLKVKQNSLVKEKAKLVEKTNLARTRVEAMISRLKTMEHGT